jgi:hypothetical protein
MTVVDGRVYSIGWDESGIVRALWASMPSGGFSLVGRLGLEDPSSTMHGVIVLDDASPVAVAAAAVVAVAGTPEVEALRPWLEVVGPGNPRIFRGNPQSYIAGAYGPERGRALIVLAGRSPAHDAVLLEAGRAVGYRCSPALGTPIGAFPHAGGWRVVGRDGSHRDVPGQSCRQAAQIAG